MESNEHFLFISHQLRLVEGQLAAFAKDGQLNHLHDLRVCIKRIRAVLSFIKITFGEKYKTDALDLIFKKAGEIRELQIHISMLHQHPFIPEQVTLQIIRKAGKYQKKFTLNIPGYLIQVKKFHKKMLCPFPSPDRKSVKTYFAVMKQKAKKSFNKQEKQEIHRFRKLVKNMMYVYDFLPKKTRKAAGLNKPVFNKIQKKAGAWHDTYSTLSFLSSIHPGRKEEYLTRLKQKEARQFNRLLMNCPGL